MVVGIVERLLVVRIFRVPIGVVPGGSVGSDGTLKTIMKTALPAFSM